MSVYTKFIDGIANIANGLANRRNPNNNNQIVACRMPETEMRAVYRTGMGQRIFTIKSGSALNDTLQFETEKELEWFNKNLLPKIKEASRFMLGFGRGIILINEMGADLSKPMRGDPDFSRIKLDVFSGDMVYVTSPTLDLQNPRYMKPVNYQVRGHLFHWTRVIDFTYVKPAEYDLPQYQYGGISESELIRDEFIADGIVTRAGARIIEISSILWHKIVGFKSNVAMGKDKDVIEYVRSVADLRSIYGDGIIDAEDDVTVTNQTLNNFQDVDNRTTARLSLVTGISRAFLIGEQPSGLNANGGVEKAVNQDTIENLQSDYLIEPITRMCEIFGIKGVKFKENQGGTPNERMDFESKVIDNAVKLSALGEDGVKYLQENDVVQKEDYSTFFTPDAELAEQEQQELAAQQMSQQNAAGNQGEQADAG